MARAVASTQARGLVTRLVSACWLGQRAVCAWCRRQRLNRNAARAARSVPSVSFIAVESDARVKRVLADSSVRQQQDGNARLAFNRACKLSDSQATVAVVAARDVNGKIVFDSARYNVYCQQSISLSL